MVETNSVITKAVLDIDTNVWEEVVREAYDGPWAFCDRAAQGAAKKAAGTAGDVANNAISNTEAARTTLTPFYRQEMNAQHAYNPGQLNELLNFANAGAHGAEAAGAGQIESEAARTRNTAGFAPALRQNALDAMRTAATTNLGVGAQDVMGAKQLNQEGAAGMNSLYNTDTATMLKAMGQQNDDINTQIKAGESGWVQNALGAVNAAANLTRAFKGK